MTTNSVPLKEPSEEMRSAFTTGGALCQTECDFCGRIHFVSGERTSDYEAGELDRLLQLAAAEPDKYITDPGDSCVATGYIDGRRVVIHCPCNTLRRYEDWIWEHRELVAKYLSTRADKEEAEARFQMKQMQTLKALAMNFSDTTARF